MPVTINQKLFNADRIHGLIERNRQAQSEERNGPTIAFLPEGRHIIRWFFDPEGELFREVMVGRVGKNRFVCPDFMSRVDKEGTYPTCELDAIAKAKNQWRDKCRYHCMVYGALYETKNTGDYWKVEQKGKPVPYVIIGNSHLKKALVDMLENLEEEGMDMLLGMLTPNIRGFFSSVSVTKGQQGSIAIQVLTKNVEPLELDEWYVPLSEVYIPQTFNEEAYRKAVAEYQSSSPANPETDGEEVSVLDEEGEVITVSTTKPVVEPSTAADILDDAVVETTNAKTAAKKTSTAAKKITAELPDHITLEMLPDECPGWANYDARKSFCGLCDYNLDCMGAREALN
jgi:hypothetical protein